MMKVSPSGNGHQDPKQADGNDSGQLALSLPVSILPPSLLGHHPMVTSFLDLRKVIIWPMKDGDEKNPLNPPDKTHPFHVCLASKRRGTQWSENLSCDPSQHDEPPIPGPSPSSETPEDVLTCEPEPEVAPTQSTEEPSENPTASSPHSHNDTHQEFTDLRPALMIPRAIVHKSINQILLEHRRLLHMIPFVDAAHRNEMHWGLREELNSLLHQALEAYPKEDITRIVSKYLEIK
ncbi:hypothetical protein O181_091531 [Austropuccinia psidii MF-1]|uniref:Uncharacterized protein n=1 Tax=Austropuccinia psidii MF-1 TaxID=1389203 RepID=A0A9Q3IXL9_9BASI|nr:hypothetical protein [Austropuccinia psidii MF-1]